jgi:hypothetical protein
MTKPISNPVPPVMAELFNQFRQQFFTNLNCHQVGEIATFDATTQTATVQIKVLRLIGDQSVPYPVLTHCPVMTLSGGKGRLTFPIRAGDPCLVLFNDRDLDNWYDSGAVAVPNSYRTHDLSDGLVIVGFRNLANKLTGISTTDTELSQGAAVIGMDDEKISLRNDVSDMKTSVDALLTTLDDLLLKLKAWVNTGGSTPNPATIIALTAVQTNLTANRTAFDDLLK